MARIFKYPLAVEPRELVMTHEGAQPLSIVVQGDIPHLYFLVDESRPLVPLVVRTVCAGETFNAEGSYYVDSFQIQDWFVGHVFIQSGGVSDPVSDRYAEDFATIHTQTTKSRTDVWTA